MTSTSRIRLPAVIAQFVAQQKTMPVERLYRDAKMTEVYVGISEIQRGIIASNLI